MQSRLIKNASSRLGHWIDVVRDPHCSSTGRPAAAWIQTAVTGAYPGSIRRSLGDCPD